MAGIPIFLGVGKVIIVASVVISLLSSFSPRGEVLGLLTGMVVKEVVLGALNTIYAHMASDGTGEEGAVTPIPYRPWAGLSAAVATIPENARALVDDLTDPLGLSGMSRLQTGEAEALAAEQGLDQRTFSRLGAQMTASAALA